MGTAQVVFCHPNDQSLQKTLKRLYQLHQFALANLLAQLLMKNEFRNLKQQLRMFEGIFDFLCNQCREKKSLNVALSTTMQDSHFTLILFHVNVIDSEMLTEIVL